MPSYHRQGHNSPFSAYFSRRSVEHLRGRLAEVLPTPLLLAAPLRLPTCWDSVTLCSSPVNSAFVLFPQLRYDLP